MKAGFLHDILSPSWWLIATGSAIGLRDVCFWQITSFVHPSSLAHGCCLGLPRFYWGFALKSHNGFPPADVSTYIPWYEILILVWINVTSTYNNAAHYLCQPFATIWASTKEKWWSKVTIVFSFHFFNVKHYLLHIIQQRSFIKTLDVTIFLQTVCTTFLMNLVHVYYFINCITLLFINNEGAILCIKMKQTTFEWKRKSKNTGNNNV